MGDRDAQYQRQIREKATRITDTIHQTNRNLYEAEGIAVATLEELNNQNEQLHQIDAKADEVDDKIRYADKQAKYLKKGWFGWLVSSEPKQKAAKAAKGAQPSTAPDNTPQGVRQRLAANVAEPSNYDSLDTTALREQGQDQLAKELALHDREYNDGLDEMSKNLERLTQMGLAIGDELDKSTQLVAGIHTKVSGSQNGVAGVNAKLRSIK